MRLSSAQLCRHVDMVWEPLFSSHVIVRVAELFFRVIKALLALMLLPIVVPLEWMGRLICRPQSVPKSTLDSIYDLGTVTRDRSRWFRRDGLPEISSPYKAPRSRCSPVDDTGQQIEAESGPALSEESSSLGERDLQAYLLGFDVKFREGVGLLEIDFKKGCKALEESDQLIHEFFQTNPTLARDKLWELHEQRNWIELILDLDPTQFSYGFHIRTEFSEISRLVDESSHTKESLRDIDILIGLVDIDRLSEEDKTPFGELKKRRLSLNVARSAE